MKKKKLKIWEDNMSKPNIEKWINQGNLLGVMKTWENVLDSCYERLDKENAHEILGGGILFKAKNGKYYTVTLEPCITEAAKNFVDDMLKFRISFRLEKHRRPNVPRHVKSKKVK